MSSHGSTAAPPGDPVWERWDALYEQRLSWAEDAHREYLATLDPDVRRHLGGQGPEVNIALYGPTQVGKTTLILKMLGLADEATTRAHEILRGGRSDGKSATATAMRYRLTDNEHWSWRDGPDMLLSATADEMRNRLAQLRDSVADGSRQTHRPVDIGIPATLRAHGATTLRISILDLPGIQAADAAERRHVKDLAARHLPNADLILLVGRADNLEFLKPAVLELPGLLDWWKTPERYRLVLTHALSLGTVASWARDHGGPVFLDDIREHHLAQLATFASEFDVGPEVVSPIMFPLDYGRSWVQMRDTQEGQRLAAGNQESFVELRTKLVASSRPEARIAQAHRAHLIAVQVMTHRRDEVAAELASARDNLDAIDRRLRLRETAADDARRDAAVRAKAAEDCDWAASTHPPRSPDPGFRDRLQRATGDGFRREYDFRAKVDAELRRALESRTEQWTKWAMPWVEQRRVADATALSLEAREHFLADARQQIEQAWRWGGPFSLFEHGSSENAIQRAADLREAGIARIDESHIGLTKEVEREAQRLRREADLACQESGKADRDMSRAREARQSAQARVEEAKTSLEERQRDLAAVREEADAFADTLTAAYRERTRLDLVDLEAATSDDERALLALNHLLTRKTYDTIRGDA